MSDPLFDNATSKKFEGLTGHPTTILGIDPEHVDMIATLGVPTRTWALIYGEQWLSRVEMWGKVLLYGRKNHDGNAVRCAAAAIGELIAHRLEQGDFSASRIVSEGLIRLQEGKPFLPKKGRRTSQSRLDVVHAFYILRSIGINEPSQKEVRDFLDGLGIKLAADRISKICDELKFDGLMGDSRTAEKRKR